MTLTTNQANLHVRIEIIWVAEHILLSVASHRSVFGSSTTSSGNTLNTPTIQSLTYIQSNNFDSVTTPGTPYNYMNSSNVDNVMTHHNYLTAGVGQCKQANYRLISAKSSWLSGC